MEQKRYWNFLADDVTADIVRWFLGFMPSGYYYGFDFAPSHDLNLVLNHAITGQAEVDSTGAATNKIGAFITKQGFVIKEDAPITLSINANASGNARIDTVVYTHEYVATSGGALAVPSIIQGTPAINPVPASLIFPNTQIVIGYLYMPAGASYLDATGVTFTHASIPFFANHADDFAYTDKINRFTKMNQENLGGTVEIQADGTLTLDDTGNFYRINNSDFSPEYIQGIGNKLYPLGTRLVFQWMGTGSIKLPNGEHQVPVSGFNISLVVGGDTGGWITEDLVLQTNDFFIATATNVSVGDSDPAAMIWKIEPSIEYIYRIVKSLVFTEKKGNEAIVAIVNIAITDLQIELDGSGDYYSVPVAAPVSGVPSYLSCISVASVGRRIRLRFENDCLLGAITNPSYLNADYNSIKLTPPATGGAVLVKSGFVYEFFQDDDDTWELQGAIDIAPYNQAVSFNSNVGGGAVVVSIAPTIGSYLSLVNIGTDEIDIKTIVAQPQHYVGYELILNFKTNFGKGAIKLISCNNGIGGNISLKAAWKSNETTFVQANMFFSGLSQAHTPNCFICFRWTGARWQEQYRSVNYGS